MPQTDLRIIFDLTLSSRRNFVIKEKKLKMKKKRSYPRNSHIFTILFPTRMHLLSYLIAILYYSLENSL